MTTRIKLLVIRSADIGRTVRFYADLGLVFIQEQAGTGPPHFAADLGGTLLEIYPAKSDRDVDRTTRLGFSVQQADHVAWADSPWGRRAVVQDPDGRKVELYLDQSEHPPAHESVDFVGSAIDTFQTHRRLTERAIEQLSDAALHIALDEQTNSIAVIIKHVGGNLRSRWTDFLTSDGEKPWRNRDDEFVDTFRSREQVMECWNGGWECLFTTLHRLTARDLRKHVFIRGQKHSVPQAIERSLGHTCYHVGQIIQVARIQAGSRWQTLTIPRGGSSEYNEANWGKPPR